MRNRSPLEGDLVVGPFPRAEALGCSVRPFHGQKPGVRWHSERNGVLEIEIGLLSNPTLNLEEPSVISNQWSVISNQ